MSPVGNAAWLLTEKVVRLTLGFVVNLAVMRHLGAERFGAYAYALSLVYMLLPLARLGLEALVVRELANGPASGRGVLARFVLPRLAAGSLAAIALVAAAGAISRDPQDAVLIVIAAGLLVAQALDVFELWAQSQALAWLTALLRIGVLGCTALARVALIASDAGAEAFIAVAVAEAAACGALVAWAWRTRRGPDVSPTAAPPPVPWREATMVLLTGLVSAAYFRCDAALLMWLSTPAQAGVFAAATPFVDALSIVPTVMATVLLPGLSRLWAGEGAGRERFWSRLEDAIAVATWAGIAAAGALSLAVAVLLVPILGAEYRDAVPVVAVLCLAVPLFFQGSLIDVYVYSDRRSHLLLVKSAAALAVKLAIAAWSVRSFGALGAALATTASVWIIGFGTMRLISPRILSISLRAFRPAACIRSLQRLTRQRGAATIAPTSND